MGSGEAFEEVGARGDLQGGGREDEVGGVGAAGDFVASIAVACCLSRGQFEGKS